MGYTPFFFLTFLSLFLISRCALARRPILTINSSYGMFPRKIEPFRAQRDIKNKERKVKKKKGRLRNQNMAYDTRCYFNVRSKADMIRLNLPHGDDN